MSAAVFALAGASGPTPLALSLNFPPWRLLQHSTVYCITVKETQILLLLFLFFMSLLFSLLLL